MNVNLKTSLPSGTYCDVNSGNKINGSCTGRVINVKEDGSASIKIEGNEENPVIAIHIESRL
jgi:alpha-amylase